MSRRCDSSSIDQSNASVAPGETCALVEYARSCRPKAGIKHRTFALCLPIWRQTDARLIAPPHAKRLTSINPPLQSP